MKRVVVESPYAGDVEANVAYARRCMLDALRRGEAPFLSHLLYTQPGVLDDTVPEDRALGIEAGLVWGAQAELAAFYIDRGVSAGMVKGLLAHRRAGVPVVCRSLDAQAADAMWSFDLAPEDYLCVCEKSGGSATACPLHVPV